MLIEFQNIVIWFSMFLEKEECIFIQLLEDLFRRCLKKKTFGVMILWRLWLKGITGPLIFRLETHEMHQNERNFITVRHANFEYYTLRTVGGVGF